MKDKRYASYVLPVRVKDGKKQVALLEYGSDGYGKIGGRFEDGETNAREVLRRELAEELNVGCDKIADTAIEIAEPYCVDVDPEWAKIRGTHREIRYIFVAPISADMELFFDEQGDIGARVVWLDAECLSDENVVKFSDEREYLKKHVLPIIRNMK